MYTPDQAASLLGVSTRLIVKLAREGRIEAYEIARGRKGLRISAAAVQGLMAEGSPISEQLEKTKSPHKPSLQALKKYKLSIGRHDQMFELQARRCKICFRAVRLVVDHCHKSGEVRGLLCAQCNSAIGFAKDNPTLLRRAADYLEGKL